MEPTVGDIDRFLTALSADGTLFGLSVEGIFRHFCGRVCRLPDPFRETLQVLRSSLPHSLRGDNGLTDSAFLEWFTAEILHLEHLPRDTMAELYDWASKDIRSIRDNITYCDSQLKRLDERPHGDHYDLDRNFLLFYRDVNREALDEVESVLASGIRDAALRRAIRAIYPLLALDIPWSYRWNPAKYDPRQFSEVEHRFSELPVQEFRRVRKAYDSSSMEFDSMLEDYHRKYQPLASLRILVDEHPRLSERGILLLPLLEAFERGDYPVFCAAAVLQIEGIFEDCCLELGVGPTRPDKESLRPKIDLLRRRNVFQVGYPFFAFRFPRLRNRLAHGRLLRSDEWERAARLLVLDLVEVSEILINLDSPGNALIKLLKSGDPGISRDVLRFACLVAEGVVAPPESAGLTEKFNLFTDKLRDSEEYWALLRQLSKDHEVEMAPSLRYIAVALKKRGIAVNRARSFLEESDSAIPKQLDRTHFWDRLEAL